MVEEAKKETKSKTGIQTVRFRQMSREQAEKYCTYKYEKRVKSDREIVELLECIYVLVGLGIYFFLEPNKRIFLGIVICLAVITPIWRKYFPNKENILIKNASNSLCEYAFLKARIGKPIKYIRENGSEIIKFMDYDDEAEVKDGDDVAIIYLAEIHQIFTEKEEILKEIVGNMETADQETEEEVSVEQEVIEEDVAEDEVVEEVEEPAQTVQLIQMSYSMAEKYYKYKYKKLGKDLFLELTSLTIFAPAIIFIAEDLKSKFIRWSVWGISILAYLALSFIMIEYFREHRKKMKKASKVSYEYATVTTEFKYPTKFICDDGHEVIWTMESNEDVENKDGKEAVVVYLTSVDQMYLESVKKFNRIYNKKCK